VRRHGLAAYEVDRALRSLAEAGVGIHSAVIHTGLTDTEAGRREEIESLLPTVPVHVPVSVSHLKPATYAELRSRYPQRRFSIRLGSALWHGEKEALRLRARVLEARSVLAGTRVGYWATQVPGDGTVVIVSAGSAHGVAPLADGSSPFHYGKRRVALIERPHMHVSMLFVPNGDPCPTPGDEVDVQRPLLATDVDRIVWQ
jgi:alanine racemase